MPSVTSTIGFYGPIAQLTDGVSQARRKKLAALGMPIPEPVLVEALIDTGSHMSGVDVLVLDRIDRRQIDAIAFINSMGELTEKSPYVRLTSVTVHLGTDQKVFPTFRVLEFEFYEEEPTRAIIGRDLLAFFGFIYDGQGKTFILNS